MTIKPGLTNGLELWTWHELAVSGSPAAARSVSLVAFDAQGRLVAKWSLTNAWPSRLKVGTLAAGSSRVLTEEVTLAADHIQRLAPQTHAGRARWSAPGRMPAVALKRGDLLRP